MGVHGLWKLIDKAGRPIPVETLENKVLAIDVSIWLYQLVKGFGSSARPGSNIFLLGLFHRICKLLFYRIKPIFVFDGGVPSLKKKTIAARQKGRRKAQESIEKVRQQLLENLIKQQAIGDVLGENVKIPKQFSSKQDELFWLPPIADEEKEEILEESDSDDDRPAKKYAGDLNAVDVNSEDFLKLPADVRHDILTDLKETRKLNSWAKIHLMPEEADDFSTFQMGRLLKRRAVQVGLDKAADELGVRGFTVNDLENILTEQGIDLSQRIAGDNSTRFIYASKPETLSQESVQNESSEDEDDVSELVRPSRLDLSTSSSSSRSEDEVLPAVQRLAQSETGDLSQQEILELIQQQHRKRVPSTENDIFDRWRASTSKQNDLTFPEEEKSKSLSEMGTHNRVNDGNGARGKSPDRNNEKSKLEPEKFPGADSYCEVPTTPQKDAPLCPNQGGEVSPHKNVTCNSNEALEEEKNRLDSNEEEICANNDTTELGSDKDDEFVDVSLNTSVSLKQNVDISPKKGLEILINPEESLEEDIFADVFSQGSQKGSEYAEVDAIRTNQHDCLQSSIEDAVAKSMLMLTKHDPEAPNLMCPNLSVHDPDTVSLVMKKSVGGDSPESSLNTNEPWEDDNSRVNFNLSSSLAQEMSLVKKVQESEAPSVQCKKPAVFKNGETTDESLSKNGNTSSHKTSLEIVINPNDAPDDDIFADIFSQPPQKSITDPESPLGTESISVTRSSNEDHNISSRVDTTSPQKTGSEQSKDVEVDKKTLEIVINPDESPDEDLFADVFTEGKESSNKMMKPSFWKLVNDIKKTSSAKELDDIKDNLERESQKLASENKREERLASTITEQITQEAQNLLELFGIPYVIAPMEAEAQCAYLDLTGQTEGTITDDSDIWLFGANNVYKNFFDQRKFVKQFKASDIFQCYRLSRDDLIMIAMLVGSDYTAGLPGVGPVNAIEIVAHFPRSDSATTPQSRLMKFVDAYLSSEMNQQLLKKLRSLEFSDGFPSDEVVKAYLSPIVDESQEKFSWSKPDLAKIRGFMRDKFGWDNKKTDHTLVPIFDKMTQSTTQKNIHNYFEWAFDVDEASTVSKRVGNAVEILTTGVVPSPTKKPKVDVPKNRLESSYSRRKYGRYQQEKEIESEPVLEGMRAARAAAKAIMAATRKPAKHPEGIPTDAGCSSGVGGLSVEPTIAPQGRQRRKHDEIRGDDGPPNDSVVPTKQKRVSTRATRRDPIAEPSGEGSSSNSVPGTSTSAPLPDLSDILCGVGSEPTAPEVPNLWTPSRDLVSPYVKRKYGRLGQSTALKKESGGFPIPAKPKESFDRVMPSKNPAQIARERAAKKLKEAKQKAQQTAKAKKAASSK